MGAGCSKNQSDTSDSPTPPSRLVRKPTNHHGHHHHHHHGHHHRKPQHHPLLRRAACTHTTLTRLYDPRQSSKCYLCHRRPPLGWLYRCTQDEPGGTLPRADFFRSKITETVFDQFGNEIVDDKTGVDELPGWTLSAIERGEYNDEQVQLLKAQKLNVRLTIEEQEDQVRRLMAGEQITDFGLKRIANGPTAIAVNKNSGPLTTAAEVEASSCVLPIIPASSDKGVEDTDNPLPLAPATDRNAADNIVLDLPFSKLHTKGDHTSQDHVEESKKDVLGEAPPKADAQPRISFASFSPAPSQVLHTMHNNISKDSEPLQPPCQYRCCHTCRPLHRDRAWQNLDTTMLQPLDAVPDWEWRNRRVCHVNVVRELGLRQPTAPPVPVRPAVYSDSTTEEIDFGYGDEGDGDTDSDDDDDDDEEYDSDEDDDEEEDSDDDSIGDRSFIVPPARSNSPSSTIDDASVHEGEFEDVSYIDVGDEELKSAEDDSIVAGREDREEDHTPHAKGSTTEIQEKEEISTEEEKSRGKLRKMTSGIGKMIGGLRGKNKEEKSSVKTKGTATEAKTSSTIDTKDHSTTAASRNHRAENDTDDAEQHHQRKKAKTEAHTPRRHSPHRNTHANTPPTSHHLDTLAPISPPPSPTPPLRSTSRSRARTRPGVNSYHDSESPRSKKTGLIAPPPSPETSRVRAQREMQAGAGRVGVRRVLTGMPPTSLVLDYPPQSENPDGEESESGSTSGTGTTGDDEVEVENGVALTEEGVQSGDADVIMAQV